MRKLGLAAVARRQRCGGRLRHIPEPVRLRSVWLQQRLLQQRLLQQRLLQQRPDRPATSSTGAAVGAVGGAIAGAVIPGVSAGTGAIAGAILGGVLGATINGRQYYRDTRGYCYYVDQYGQPHYNYNIRC